MRFSHFWLSLLYSGQQASDGFHGRVGIYLGRSPSHASDVALVLNLKTAIVSSQFHVVFYDNFTTVPHLRRGTVPKNWELLVRNSRERSTDEFYNLTKTWFQAIPDETAEDLENLSPHRICAGLRRVI